MAFSTAQATILNLAEKKGDYFLQLNSFNSDGSINNYLNTLRRLHLEKKPNT